MDPHSPNKLFATKYCFLILVDDTSFFFFISLFLFFLVLFYVIINFYKNHFIFFFFHDNFFLFFYVPGCSWSFRNVPAYSGMFRVPGFIDALNNRGVACENIRFSSLVVAGDVSREASPATKSEEKRMFSQANRVVNGR